MEKYNESSDEKLRRNLLSYDPENDPRGDMGHGLAEAALQRAKRAGKSIEDWLKKSKNVKHSKILGNPSLEKEVAEAIYKTVSSQRLYLGDAEILVARLLKEHGYTYLTVRGNPTPLSKARKYMIDYVRILLFKNNLPMEPAEEPDKIPILR